MCFCVVCWRRLGFWYAHVGWMLVKQDPTKIGRADITDLNNEAFIRFQHKYYGLFGESGSEPERGQCR